jgi:hypothetical protein
VAVADDVVDEEAEDDDEQDVVAGTKLHRWARAAADRRCGS